MTSRDDLEDWLADLEQRFGVGERLALAVMLGVEETWEVDPDTLEATRIESPDRSGAVIADAVHRDVASGVEVFMESDVDDFERRLADGLDALAAGGGPDLDAEDVVGYIAGRWRGELPPGEPGVTQQFGEDATKADLDRLGALVTGTGAP